MKLTIFTATYNRAHLIGRIYESLLRQSVFDFEWLVIDDGSTDNTRELFDDILKKDNPFPIRYYRQENKGLIRTLNRGIELAEGEYLSKIDSDDYVVDNFAELVLTWLNDIQGNEQVYAVGGLRVTPDMKPIKGVMPSIHEGQYVDASDIERAKYNLDADMTEAWRVSVLRKYKFPVWEGEKFAPEQIVFHQIALDGYAIRWRPVPLVICEYQEGGLTLGASKLEKENPMGYAMMYNQQLKRPDFSFMQKLKCGMNFVALCIVGNSPSYIAKANSKGVVALALLPGMLLSIRRKRQYSKRS